MTWGFQWRPEVLGPLNRITAVGTALKWYGQIATFIYFIRIYLEIGKWLNHNSLPLDISQ